MSEHTVAVAVLQTVSVALPLFAIYIHLNADRSDGFRERYFLFVIAALAGLLVTALLAVVQLFGNGVGLAVGLGIITLVLALVFLSVTALGSFVSTHYEA
jgi:hypothetical protein